jgi:hypothetical protein
MSLAWYLTAAKIVKPAISQEWLNKRISEAVKSGRDVDDAIKELSTRIWKKQTRISLSPTFVKKYSVSNHCGIRILC